MLTLRPHQLRAKEAIYNWFQNQETDPLVSICTGGGKSLIIASICEDSQSWRNQHVQVLVHSQELVEQNHQELFKLCPEINAGIYCAGLGKKQIKNVTFASIQSITKIKEVPWCDLLIVDEVQAVNDEKDNSVYASYIARLRAVNPAMRCVGLSATIWRMGSGLLHEGDNRLFGGLAYEYSIADGVKDGYLVPLVGKHSKVQGNRANIGISAGDFKIQESEAEFDKSSLTEAAIDEIQRYGSDRKSWLVFAVTIAHAEHICEALRKRGIESETVSDKTPKAERKRILSAYKERKFRALVSVNIAAVGFNATCVDLIAILRPTTSPGWHVQALGRGTRLHPGKENCLVLDFAGNLKELGPVSHVTPPRRRGKKAVDDEIGGRVCQKCDSVNPRSATECLDCGYTFPVEVRKIKHSRYAADNIAMSNEAKISDIPTWLDITFVHYSIHTKIGSSTSLKVGYKSEAQWVYEWVCFGHAKAFPRRKAEDWWGARGGLKPAPLTAQEAMERLQEIANFCTNKIKVKKNGNFSEIVNYDFDSVPTDINHRTGNLGDLTATQWRHVEPVKEDIPDDNAAFASY